jgi:hypothetical protein
VAQFAKDGGEVRVSREHDELVIVNVVLQQIDDVQNRDDHRGKAIISTDLGAIDRRARPAIGEAVVGALSSMSMAVRVVATPKR